MSVWERWDALGKMPVVGSDLDKPMIEYLNTYLPIAQKFYKNDVVGYSRMILTIPIWPTRVDSSKGSLLAH